MILWILMRKRKYSKFWTWKNLIDIDIEKNKAGVTIQVFWHFSKSKGKQCTKFKRNVYTRNELTILPYPVTARQYIFIFRVLCNKSIGSYNKKLIRQQNWKHLIWDDPEETKVLASKNVHFHVASLHWLKKVTLE